MNCDALIYFALDSSTWTTVLNALDPLPRLKIHLIITIDLLWNRKILNLKKLKIIKDGGLVLSSTIV